MRFGVTVWAASYATIVSQTNSQVSSVGSLSDNAMIENVDEADLPEVRRLIATSLRTWVVSNTTEVDFLMGEIDKILQWSAEKRGFP